VDSGQRSEPVDVDENTRGYALRPSELVSQFPQALTLFATERSGKKKWVHFRWACPKFLRQSFHEWAGHSIAQSVWARTYYQQQRQRGKDHHAAVRALAFKWIRIVFRCWQDGVAYDENRYLATLAKRGSPLIPVPAVAAPSL
jgi:hypothetical protein